MWHLGVLLTELGYDVEQAHRRPFRAGVDVNVRVVDTVFALPVAGVKATRTRTLSRRLRASARREAAVSLAVNT
jgi:hypothetical protein